MRFQHIGSFMYIYIFCRTRRSSVTTQYIYICVLCEDVAMIGTQLHTLYATSLLFILAILHNTPYCITKIFNISKSYLYTSIPLYRGCVVVYLCTRQKKLCYTTCAHGTAKYLHTIFVMWCKINHTTPKSHLLL